MEYYTLHVLPACPLKDGCVCQLENIQVSILIANVPKSLTVSYAIVFFLINKTV